tara:strand:- start:1999 stop:2595 length:597 start_codon:yes stop_codon:yes gene_type:complete
VLEENGRADPELVIYFMVVMLSSSAVSLLFMILDELYKIDQFFISLPVTRTQMVKAKYCSSLLQTGFAFVVHFLGTQFGIYLEGSINYPDLVIIYNPMWWLIVFTLLLVFKSYAYPIYFKFGLIKGIAIQSILQFLCFVFFVIIMINFSKIWNYFQNGLIWVFNQNMLTVLMACAVSIILVMNGSVTVSIKVFKNKDI